MKYDNHVNPLDNGPNPTVVNVEQLSLKNNNFRTAIWTGEYAQMTLMSIPPFGDIGLEMHQNLDQFVRIEHGKAILQMGCARNRMDFERYLNKGDVVFVPAGTWHNIKNNNRFPLKLSSVYAPPNHARGTVHITKEYAQKEED